MLACALRDKDERTTWITIRVDRIEGRGIIIVVLNEAAFDVEIPARLAWAPALRGDENDPICCLRPVQRGGRRTFDDLDRLNLFRVDVVEARRLLPTDTDGVDPKRRSGVVNPSTVNVNEWLVAERQAVGSPDANFGAGSGGSDSRGDHDTRRPRAQEIREAGDSAGVHFVHRVDGSDVVSDLPAALVARCGHHQLVQQHHQGRQLKIGNC